MKFQAINTHFYSTFRQTSIDDFSKAEILEAIEAHDEIALFDQLRHENFENPMFSVYFGRCQIRLRALPEYLRKTPVMRLKSYYFMTYIYLDMK
jgi:hypothetical protein